MKKSLVWIVLLIAMLVPINALQVPIQTIPNGGNITLAYGINQTKVISCQEFKYDNFVIDVEIPINECGTYLTNVSCKVPDNINCNLPESYRIDIGAVRTDVDNTRKAIINEFNLTGQDLLAQCKSAGLSVSQVDGLRNIIKTKDMEIATLVVLLILACILSAILLLSMRGDLQRLTGRKKDLPQFPPQLMSPPHQPPQPPPQVQPPQSPPHQPPQPPPQVQPPQWQG